MVSQMVAVLPCCFCVVPLKPFSTTYPLNTNPLNTLGFTGLYKTVLYTPPQWQYLHITSNLPHAAKFISSNMNEDDVNILPQMTHFKHFVQWPRIHTNLNDSLSVSGHHLAKGGVGVRGDYSVRILGLSFPSVH